MGFLILAIAATSIISIIMRLSGNHVSNKILMFSTNYVVCIICSLFFIGDVSGFGGSQLALPIWFGILTGVIYLCSFLFLEFNIRKNGVVLSSTFAKLGVLVPIFISVVFFKEIPGPLKIVGIVLALAAIIITNFKKSKDEAKGFNIASLLLVGLLLLSGTSDATSTIFEHLGEEKLQGLFLTCIFSSALVCSLIVLLIQRKKISKYDVIFGVVLGIFNYFSSYFLINSLNSIQAVIVYPTYSVASIVIVTLVGVFFFKEKLKIKDYIGIVLIMGAVVLLNI